MSSLGYVGKNAAATRDVMNKLGVDGAFTGGVSLSALQTKVNTAVSPLAQTTVVDANDALLATKSYVDTQDGKRILLTQKGVANGVATLDASGMPPVAQLAKAPRETYKGPYIMTVGKSANNATVTLQEAYFDNTAGGQWDKDIGGVTIPAPGAGFGSWRPLVLGRVEVYNTTGRTDVYARISNAYDCAKAFGHNYGSVQPYTSWFIPRSDVNSQVPGGWADTTPLTINFYVQAAFDGSRGGVITNGQHNIYVFAIPC